MTPSTITDFDTLRGEIFHIDGGPDALTLTVVAPLPRSPREGGGFRLEFAGAPDLALQQGTYRLVNAMCEADIFVVPVARSDGGTTFEAVFN